MIDVYDAATIYYDLEKFNEYVSRCQFSTEGVDSYTAFVITQRCFSSISIM